jgi:hypothetical protein
VQPSCSLALADIQATVEKLYNWLTVEDKDIRKGTWTNKEASLIPFLLTTSLPICDDIVPSTLNPALRVYGP